MAKRDIRTYIPGLPIDYAKQPYSTAYKGLWKQEVEGRTIVTFMPENYFPYIKGVLIFVPVEIAIEDFVEQSAWVDFAEQNNAALLFLSAPDGRKDLDAEKSFYYKAYGQAFHSVGVISYDMKYAVGYGSSATFLAKAFTQECKLFGGAVLFDPDDLTESDLASAADTRRMPVWIVNQTGKETPRLTEYYKARNRCLDEHLRNDWAQVFNENPLALEESHTNTPCSRVWVSSVDKAAALYTDIAWCERAFNEFLIKRYHHDHLSITQLKPNYTLDELGMRVYRERMPFVGMEGLQERIFAVYAPTDYDAEKKYPVVVVSHGFECTYEYMAKNTEFWKLAEQRKFIAVFTQGLPLENCNYGLPRWRSNGIGISRMGFTDDTETIGSEIAYFRKIIETLRRDYSVDDSRIYCTGHSNGSAMTYALSMMMGDVFAASAQVGGPVQQFSSLEDMPKEHYKMPAMEISCEFDRCTDPDDKDSVLYQELLWRRVENGVPLEQKPVIVDNGITITHTWRTCSGLPVVKYAFYRDSSHSYHSNIACFVWDEFLCGYSKDADGNRYYGGQLIR